MHSERLVHTLRRAVFLAALPCDSVSVQLKIGAANVPRADLQTIQRASTHSFNLKFFGANSFIFSVGILGLMLILVPVAVSLTAVVLLLLAQVRAEWPDFE